MSSAPYTALARRYRPQTFHEVIGQSHVGQALRNALKKGRVSHAYLFTGARGVGKTSTARIFAKALNCPNAVDGVPCNECDICHAISVGSDVDVMEIDAASNRGIDDVRQLRANVGIRPMRSANKVYIIDEAHQLSRDAWNALLKTLEEPPPNVKFFFCTTEPNKLPDTILSRCQRFDFSTVETPNIVARLEQIAASEGFTVEPAALQLVARRAAGSMRDSQSLFDQLLAFGSERITTADVHRLFGTAEDERLIDLAACLASHEPGKALSNLSGVLETGVQLEELFDQLIGYFRDLIVLSAGAGGVELISVSIDQSEKLAEQAARLGLNTLLAATQILSEARVRMQRATFARPIAELALVRVALLNDLDEISGLIAALKTGPTGKTAGPSAERAGAAPAARRPIPTTADATAPQKKSNDAAVNGTPRVAAEPITNASAPTTPISASEIQTPKIALENGNESALLAGLLARAPLDLRFALGQVSTVAILGPLSLELHLPAAYDAARRQLESPANRDRVGKLASEIAGGAIQVTLRSPDDDRPRNPGDSKPSPSRASGKIPGAKERQRPAGVPDEDEFVRRAVSLFEAKVLKVAEIGRPDAELESNP